MAKNLEQIPKEMMQEWLQHPVTLEVLQCLQETRKHFQSQMLEGATLNLNSSENTALRTAQHLGIISGLNIILEMEIGDKDE